MHRMRGRDIAALPAMLLLLVLFVVGTLQIVFRYVLSHPLVWAEEAMRLLFVLLVFTGAAAASLSGEHIVVDLLRNRLEARVSRANYGLYTRAIAVAMAAFFGLSAYGAYRMAVVRWHTDSPTISWWHVGYMYAGVCLALAAGAVLTLVHAFGRGPGEERKQ